MQLCVGFFRPLLGLRVRHLVSEEMSSSTDNNLLISYDGMLVNGSKESLIHYINSQLTITSLY